MTTNFEIPAITCPSTYFVAKKIMFIFSDRKMCGTISMKVRTFEKKILIKFVGFWEGFWPSRWLRPSRSFIWHIKSCFHGPHHSFRINFRSLKTNHGFLGTLSNFRTLPQKLFSVGNICLFFFSILSSNTIQFDIK